jgi:hypothetical protein
MVLKASFITVFLDEFSSMASQSFNQEGGIWHPQEFAKKHSADIEPAAYSGGSVSWEFFSKCVSSGNKEEPFTFALKEGLNPSDALGSFERETTILDSGCAYMLVFYRALCSYLGEEKFNALYERDRFILRAHPYDTLTKFFFERIEILESYDVKPGDQCRFNNLMMYSAKHGLPEDTYVVCGLDDNFMGLGLQGTQRKVEEAMLEQFNEPTRVVDGGSLSNNTVTYEEFRDKRTSRWVRQEGRLALEVLRLHTARIEQMKDTPIEKLDDLLESWGHRCKRQRPDSPDV